MRPEVPYGLRLPSDYQRYGQRISLPLFGNLWNVFLHSKYDWSYTFLLLRPEWLQSCIQFASVRYDLFIGLNKVAKGHYWYIVNLNKCLWISNTTTIRTFSFKVIHFKLSIAKCWPFYLDPNIIGLDCTRNIHDQTTINRRHDTKITIWNSKITETFLIWPTCVRPCP